MYRIFDTLEEVIASGPRRCVIVGADDSDVVRRIAAALRNSEIALEVVPDLLAAFARLMLHGRLDQTRAAWGLRPVGTTAIIIGDADAHAQQFEAFTVALESHAEDQVVLYCDSGGPAGRDAGPTGGSTPANRSDFEPRMSRRSDDARGYGSQEMPDAVHTAEGGHNDAEENTPEPLVTQEELAMLLSDPDADDEQRDEGSGP